MNYDTTIPDYATHDDRNIKGFFGEKYRVFSNFWPCRIEYDGLVYGSTEAAYQAAKVTSENRGGFTTCNPWTAKNLWKTLPRQDATEEAWNARKLQVMTYITLEKYNKHLDLRRKLLSTGNRYLEETNCWGDTYWGVDINRGGENKLGKLLMNVRIFWETHGK